MKTDTKQFSQQHAPKLAENITRLCGQVIAKGIQGHLEIALEMQDRITELEQQLVAASADRTQHIELQDGYRNLCAERSVLQASLIETQRQHVALANQLNAQTTCLENLRIQREGQAATIAKLHELLTEIDNTTTYKTPGLQDRVTEALSV